MKMFLIMALTHSLTAILACIAGYVYRGQIKKKLGEE